MYREQKDAAGVLPAGPVDPDEMLMRQTPNGAVAPGERFEDASFEGAGFDSAGFDSASRLEDPDAPLSPASGTGWPPTGLPVALWPAEMLREALTGGPGVGLARLVAEAADVEGQLDAGPDSAGSTSGVTHTPAKVRWPTCRMTYWSRCWVRADACSPGPQVFRPASSPNAPPARRTRSLVHGPGRDPLREHRLHQVTCRQVGAAPPLERVGGGTDGGHADDDPGEPPRAPPSGRGPGQQAGPASPQVHRDDQQPADRAHVLERPGPVKALPEP
jgi:hypothetical protein